MCNIEARPVNTRPVTESLHTCGQNELSQVKQDLEALKAENAQLRTEFNQLRDEFQAHKAGGPEHCPVAPGTGCLQAPSLDMCGAPAGKGLQTNPEGWPQGSVRTAGGYTIVPEGKDAAWSVFGPDQKAGDKPMTRVWGDPHVDEKDGTRWDFTKDSSFRLPDGTMIAVDTTSETGQSVSKGLTIVNGADRVNIAGIDQNKPQFVDDAGKPVSAQSAVTRDGYEFRNQLIADNPCRDTFVLGGDGDKNVSWFRERGGEIEGLITGSKSNVDGKGSYDQVVDRGQKFHVCPNLLPPVGSAAWGNALRSELVDVASHALPKEMSKLATANVALDDAVQRFNGLFMGQVQDQLKQLFGNGALGGLFSLFGGGDVLGRGCSAVGGLGDNMLEQWSLLSLFGQHRSQSAFA